jgi:cytochrome c biogenesis protein CcmG, thiol:disulfide interchange protein DsbE
MRPSKAPRQQLSYNKQVRTPLLALLCAALLALPGCDRGAHPGQIGRPAPNIRIPDGAHTLALDQFRGKVVVLNFWASWCPPCVEEAPSLDALQQQNPSLVVLEVSFDHDPAAYRQFLAEYHITARTFLDTTEQTNRAFGTTRPPETFVIDRKGVIRRKFIGAQNWVDPEIVGYLRAL